MASDFFRKIETAARALDSLFSVLESGQEIEIIYRGGMDGGRTAFSLQVRGRTCGDTARNAADNARRLKQNLDLALGAQSGLRFDDGIPQDDAAEVRRPKWRGRLHPQGMLVSAQQALKGLPQEAPLQAVLISPCLPATASGLSIIDTVLASPQTVEIVVSIKPYRLDEPAKQVVRSILGAMGTGKAAYFMLPERRKASAEEREILVMGLEQHLKRWLINPSGIELNCTVYSAERPSETLMAMLGNVLFPNQPVALSIEPFGPGLPPSQMSEEECGALELRRCLNATCDFPVLFPCADQLADAGAKRCYPRPLCDLASTGLRLGIAGDREVYLAQADRSRHTYIIGATGSGKSTLLYNMITQDIADGEGVCLIDPHGDLYRNVLDAVPAGRAKDVVLFDPCDFDHAVGLNFLECTGSHPQVQMNLIVNEMIKIFDRLYDLRQTGGPMFELYMRNALLLVMDNDAPGTLMDVPRVFEDKDYRDYLKRICKNPLVVRFWSEQAERAGGESALANIAPYITSKLNQFTHNALLRPIIGQRKSTIDFRQVMDHRQILLVNLSKGLLGELDTQMLGMLLIGKLFFATMGRVDVSETQRTPFHWYVDEFQNFTTDTVAHLLSESRKFGIRLTLANQNMAQLNRGYGRDNLMEAVLGNVGNLLFFRMGAADAERLVTYTRPELGSQDLQYLPDFHAAARLLKHNAPLRPFVFQSLPKQKRMMTAQATRMVRDTILNNCRKHYTRPVSEVEKEIIDQVNRAPHDNASEKLVGTETGETTHTATMETESGCVDLAEMRLMKENELLALSIEKCSCFSICTSKSLRGTGITILGELVRYSEHELISANLTTNAVGEICWILTEVGLALAEETSSTSRITATSKQNRQEKDNYEEIFNKNSASSDSIPIITGKSADKLRREIIDEWRKDLEEIEREINGNKE
jgi:hypothetical protein